MKITKKALNSILFSSKKAIYETGGILGAKDGVIEYTVFDKGLKHAKCSYEPDVDYLNAAIKKWQENNIEFIGMFHVHFFDVKTLSPEDTDYIKKILSAMPEGIDRLYFPIVCTTGVIIPYVAIREANEINIIKDILEVI